MGQNWIRTLHLLLGISVIIICEAQISLNSHQTSPVRSGTKTNTDTNTTQSVVQDFFALVAAQTEDAFDRNEELDCTPQTSSQVKDCLRNIIFSHEFPIMQICPYYQDLYNCHNLGFERCISRGSVLGIDEIQLLFFSVFNANAERNGCDRVQDGRLPLTSSLTTQTGSSNATYNEGWTQTTTTTTETGKLSCSNATPKILTCPEPIAGIMRERCEFNRDPPAVCYKRGLEKCVSTGQAFEKAAMWHSCRAN